MTDKPEIKTRPKIEVGQYWETVGKGVVRVLATDGRQFAYPVIVELDNGFLQTLTDLGFAPFGGKEGSPFDLDRLVPAPAKRVVALYRFANLPVAVHDASQVVEGPDMRRISEPLTIEFTLLPGETA